MPERSTRFAALSSAVQREAAPEWRPRCDIYRTRSGWLLKFDLAGVRPEDVSVRTQSCRVTVSGRRRDWLLEAGYSYYSMEISYNRFERTIDLPCELQNPEITLEFRDGILLVRVTTER